MEYIEVTGGNPLRGSIRPAAAKNSVLPLLAATLLCAQPCTLRRVPLLRDVQTSLDLLRAVGSGAAWAGQDLLSQPACWFACCRWRCLLRLCLLPCCYGRLLYNYLWLSITVLQFAYLGILFADIILFPVLNVCHVPYIHNAVSVQ